MEDLDIPRDALRKIFDSYDEDQSGSIESGELQALCKDLGLNLGTMDLKAAMLELDVDGSGTVEWDEFFSWFASSKTVARKIVSAKQKAIDEGREMFRRYDADNSGFIEKKEWLQIWKELFGNGGKLTKELMRSAKKEHGIADNDGDGKISEDEFIVWLTNLGLYS